MGIARIIAAGITLTFAVPAVATTINFDQLPDGTTLPPSGTTISTQYASLGVTFSGTNTVTDNTGPLNSWGYIAATGPGGSGNYLGNFGAIPPSSPPGPNDYLNAPRYDVSSVQFIGTASGISFGLNTQGGQNSVAIRAYDASGVVLQSFTGVTANEGRFEIKTVTASGVARLEIVGGFNANGSARIYGIDNLTFTLTPAATAVPEPEGWTMMIAGFGITGAMMRRRKARAAVDA